MCASCSGGQSVPRETRGIHVTQVENNIVLPCMDGAGNLVHFTIPGNRMTFADEEFTAEDFHLPVTTSIHKQSHKRDTVRTAYVSQAWFEIVNRNYANASGRISRSEIGLTIGGY